MIDENTQKAILTAGSMSLLVTYISSLGFSAYIALTTTIHAIGTILGVTFAIGTYTSATTLLGVLLGPVGWTLIVAAALTAFFAPNYDKLLKFVIFVHVNRLSKISKSTKNSINQINSHIWEFRVNSNNDIWDNK
mgnify:CR=1 FL=1